jgi:hypothetical protein
MSPDEFRTAALKVPGAIESAHMNHPDFRVNGKIFASLGYPDEGWGMVKLTPAQQRAFMAEAPKIFSPCVGAWGRNGATGVHLRSAKQRILGRALRAAAENVLQSSKPSRTGLRSRK